MFSKHSKFFLFSLATQALILAQELKYEAMKNQHKDYTSLSTLKQQTLAKTLVAPSVLRE
jgi:hypothetical protein